MKTDFWKDYISNPKQLGGIETSVLDTGKAKGVRIAWINTGAGLRYKVVLDRAMDIAEAFFNADSIAYISHNGIVAPEPFSNKGIDWLRTFGGGLLTTCGLTHIGGPESDEYGERGLHGNISNIPAEIISIEQPDPVNGKFDMSITGIIREATFFGTRLELKRTISGVLGQLIIKIHDEITNIGNTDASHMLLYHVNCGWPLIDEGTTIVWDGKWKTSDDDPDNRVFNSRNNFKSCPAPMDAHSGYGEDVAFIEPAADQNGDVLCGFANQKSGIGLFIRFNKKQLPWLVNWQHWGKGEYVTALEPATNPPIGQSAARKANTLTQITPGSKKVYDLELGIISDKEALSEFLKINKK